MRVKWASRRGRSNKAKGAGGEIEVRDLVQAWWRQVEPECVFARTPSSGGWSAPAMRGEFKVAGDLTTTARYWPFTVEVKRREGWSERGLLTGGRSPVWGWWKQVVISAAEECRLPLLWFRRSHEGWFVMMPLDVATKAGVFQRGDIGYHWDRAALNVWVHPVVVRAAKLLASDPGRFVN